VAQRKKSQVKQAILDAAYRLFSERGYSNTNIPQIANLVGVSPANLYVYFRSKLDVLFSIYDPWLMRHFDDLERSLSLTHDPAQRLKKILTVVWRDIPSANNGFANNMMQAFSMATIREGYSPVLRLAVEKRLIRLLGDCIPQLGRANLRHLADIILMAFDGYVLNFHLHKKATCPVKRIDFFVDMVLRYARPSAAFDGIDGRPGLSDIARSTAISDSRPRLVRRSLRPQQNST
jgi:AcrR family transcriptional regulator